MARILAVTWDGGGNVPPMLGIADELRRRAHDVRVLGHARQRIDVTAQGIEFTPYSHAMPWAPCDTGSGAEFVRSYVRLFTDLGPGDDVRETLRDWPADLVLVDCLSLGALRAALRASLPTVVLTHMFRKYTATVWAHSPIGLIATLQAMTPSRMWAAADRELVASDSELDPASARPLPPNVRYIGVVQSQPAGPAALDGTTVLVSLSTIHYPGQASTLQVILDALADVPVRAVATTGEGVDPAALAVPANVELHRYLPHDKIMPTASLVVGHGGHATTMRALAHDLPLLVLPLFAQLDQPMVGDAIAAAGAGLTLPPTSSPERIRDAIRTLLSDGSHRTAAAAAGARLREQDGAAAAADEVEVVLASRL